ncbi:MAG: recombinase RecT [Blastocatellia bacterium]
MSSIQNQEKALTPVQKVSTFLEKFKSKLVQALPKGRNVDQEISSVIATVVASPALQKCTPESIALAAYDAATLGLPVNKLGLAWLVPFGSEAKLQIGYRGYVQLVLESGFVTDISAECVYENDKFKYVLGSKPFMSHEPLIIGDRGRLIAVYAIAYLVNGTQKSVVMSKQQIDHIKSKSRSSANGPWVTDYDEMAKKTVVKRLCKLLPYGRGLERFEQASQMEDKSSYSFSSSPVNLTSQSNIHKFVDIEVQPEEAEEHVSDEPINPLLDKLFRLQEQLEMIDPKAEKLPTNIANFGDIQLQIWIDKKIYAIGQASKT